MLYYQKKPVGFCIANIQSTPKDIEDFYIVPIVRRKNLGYQLAKKIFDTYPGQWQVRQISGAHHAIRFWRNVIGKYTKENYHEEICADPSWGKVTRQSFSC